MPEPTTVRETSRLHVRFLHLRAMPNRARDAIFDLFYRFHRCTIAIRFAAMHE